MIAGLIAAAAVATAVEAPGPVGALSGTLLTPFSNNAPVVLIIPGSGPTDRDGNNRLGVAAASYRLLADALAGRGVATLRIDKRGIAGSRGAVADPNAVTLSDYAADVRAWTEVARAKTGAPCVWLLGHSEGSLIALVALQSAPDVCGAVLVAGAGRPLADIVREQLRANPANAPLLPAAEAAIDSLEAGRRVDVVGMPAALLGLFAPQVQGFVIDQMSYDPAELIAATDKPLLILQGTTDIQVGMADAERLADAQPKAKLVRLEGMNHVLKAAPADRAANIATYTDPDLPLAPGLAETIADFILAPH